MSNTIHITAESFIHLVGKIMEGSAYIDSHNLSLNPHIRTDVFEVIEATKHALHDSNIIIEPYRRA